MPKQPFHDWECPYCKKGEHNGDDFYFGEGCHEVTCGRCEREYTVSVSVSIDCTTYAKELPEPSTEVEG